MTSVAEVYRERYEQTLVQLAAGLEAYLKERLLPQPRIDRISARAKSVDRFIAKASKLTEVGPKYTEPFQQIQDQIGARIITFYLGDVDRISGEVKRYFNFIEAKAIAPESESEFGYVGQHFILPVPSDVIEPRMNRDHVPEFFELQIKTLFQHAWSEAGHDLGYKPEAPLSIKQKRSLAFTAAQAWGADQIFHDLFEQQKVASASS